MITTIPQDLLISFVIGVIFALSAAPMLEKEESMINTYFIRALVFQVVLFFPIGLFLAWKWTAWSWLYLVEPHSESKLWTFLAVLAYIPMMIAGFHITYLCIRLGKKSQAYWYLAGGALALILLSIGLAGRVYHVANDYVPPSRINQQPTWFESGWFLLSMIIIGAIFIGGVYYVLKLNASDRKRMARQDFSSQVT